MIIGLAVGLPLFIIALLICGWFIKKRICLNRDNPHVFPPGPPLDGSYKRPVMPQD